MDQGRRVVCGECGAKFVVCRSCERGQRYCPGACAKQARARQLKIARRRHQQSQEGRADHRDRNRRHRSKRHGSARVMDTTSKNLANESKSRLRDGHSRRRIPLDRCLVCGRSLLACRRGTAGGSDASLLPQEAEHSSDLAAFEHRTQDCPPELLISKLAS